MSVPFNSRNRKKVAWIYEAGRVNFLFLFIRMQDEWYRKTGT
jgi:hypothetical protein